MSVNALVEEYAEKLAQAGAANSYNDTIQLNKEFVQQIKQLSLPEDEIAKQLTLITTEPCRANTRLWFLAAEIHPSQRYMKSLCQILEIDRDCVLHEQIVDILYELANPESIPSLAKALTYSHDYDPTRELAVKIVETLSKIGGSAAEEILSSCLTSPVLRVREKAQLLLTGIVPDYD